MVIALGPGLEVESFATVDVEVDPNPLDALDDPIADPVELVVLAPVKELRLVLPSFRLLAATAVPKDVAAANWLLGS